MPGKVPVLSEKKKKTGIEIKAVSVDGGVRAICKKGDYSFQYEGVVCFLM